MFGQTWKMAVNAVFANKLRTFLTMLGIIIGVAALIILVSIADGASNSVTERISSMGANYLMVRISNDVDEPIRFAEIMDLMSDERIEEVAPFGKADVTAKSGYTNGTMTIYGTSGSYFDIMQLELLWGRNLKMTDQDNYSYVILLTEETAIELFGHANAVGESVSCDGRNFQVIGIVEDDETTQMAMQMGKGSSKTEDSVSLMGYVPYTTMTRLGDNAAGISQMYISSADKSSMDDAQTAVTEILTERLGEEDDFSIINQSQVMEAMEEAGNTLSLMLGGIATISLLVGGIGIMNIMLVSVTERTKEIGIRKAIGAGKGSILAQFLMEAVLVSLAGCLVGIVFSWIALRMIENIMGNTISLGMNMHVVLISVIFSMMIGVIFGLYPAGKAANKKPIDALRYTG